MAASWYSSVAFKPTASEVIVDNKSHIINLGYEKPDGPYDSINRNS